MDTKHIRFGFVCRNASFVTADMLPSLHVKSMECALTGDKQFVVFTVEKPIRACDVVKAVEEFNANGTVPVTLEKFNDSEDMIVVFEKGQRYLQHPFYSVIQEAKNSDQPQIWEWTSDGVPESMRSKRVAGDLVSDLVEDSILPSAPKRDRSKVDGVSFLFWWIGFYYHA
jgi:hypothetical protein